MEPEDQYWPPLGEAYQTAVHATRVFVDAAHVEETNWTGWGDQVVPASATMRRVKAEQALLALRDADPAVYASLPAPTPVSRASKQSSQAISSLAARLIGMDDDELRKYAIIASHDPEPRLSPEFCREVRSLAASVMSQDETKG